jgi:hypothetical protein
VLRRYGGSASWRVAAAPEDALGKRPVLRRVNSDKAPNDDPDLIEPAKLVA